jgi:hypothetical protein
MGEHDLLLQDLHQRRTELLQLIDELVSGQVSSGDPSLLDAWKEELARIEQQISEFETRNT